MFSPHNDMMSGSEVLEPLKSLGKRQTNSLFFPSALFSDAAAIIIIITSSFVEVSSVICACNSVNLFFVMQLVYQFVLSQFLFIKRSVMNTLMKCKIKIKNHSVIKYQFESNPKLKSLVETNKINWLK
jgi:hypothetical protein